jgi:hypothetical protein
VCSANTEALAVNQAWAGMSGTVFAQANLMVNLGGGSAAPAWQLW